MHMHSAVKLLEIVSFTAESILVTEEYEFPAKTVFANNSMHSGMQKVLSLISNMDKM